MAPEVAIVKVKCEPFYFTGTKHTIVREHFWVRTADYGTSTAPVQMLLESTTYAYVDLVWVANTRSISAVLPAPVSTNRRLRSCLLTLVVMVVMTELFQFSRIISLLGMKQIDRISTLCESTHIRGAAVYYKLNTKE